MYKSANDILELVKSSGKNISDIIFENECDMQGLPYDNTIIRQNVLEIYDTMVNAAKKTLEVKIPSVSGLSGGDAKRLYTYLNDNQTVCGKEFLTAISYALSTSEVNASMGLIAASPTAGSSGIVPGALIYVVERFGILDRETIANALIVAGGIGQLIELNATLSGAEGGCQAECGSAASMAAGAVVFLRGGTAEMIFNAAAFALKNVMGLVCDPIAGLVECPCIKRNASGAANALLCSDMALSGIMSIVPFDEVVKAMAKVGRSMPMELRETALGGLATTPTGKQLKKNIQSM